MVSKKYNYSFCQKFLYALEDNLNIQLNKKMDNVIFRNIGKILMFITVILGIIARLIHLLFIGFKFPDRYGGLFFEFSRQIAGNHFLLPTHIPYYTNNGIPFAYPPLPFYIEALLINIFSFPKFSVINLLSPIMSIISLLLLILLTYQLKLDLSSKIFALITFSLMPACISELVQAGGLAEAFGSFMLIFFAYILLRTSKVSLFNKSIIIGIAWALCIVSSPGSAYASVPTFIVFIFLSDLQQKNQKLPLSIMAFSFAVLFSSVYWFPVIKNHGIIIFIGSFISQHPSGLNPVLAYFYKLIEFNWSGVFLWSLLIFFGFIISIFRKQLVLPIWYVLLILIPRENSWLVAIPAALLAGIGASFGLSQIIKWGNNYQKTTHKLAFYSIIGVLFFINSITPAILNIKENIEGHTNGLSKEFIVMIEWVRNNTTPNSKFIVLSSGQILEWFPTMAQRTVLNIPYGSEWEPKERHNIILLNSQIENCNYYQCVFNAIYQITGYTNYIIVLQKDKLRKYGMLDDNHRNFLWENEKFLVLEVIDWQNVNVE